jgi:Rieske Fe-S protein
MSMNTTPIVLTDDNAVPRREFLSQATLTAVAAVLAACSGGGEGVTGPTAAPNPEPTPGTSGSSLTVTLAAFGPLASVGGIAAVGNLGTKPVAVVRTGSASYTALSRICTHAGCDINVQGSGFSCPCHGSQFNSEGKATAGPAEAALQRFNVAVSSDGTKITIS